MKAVKSEQEINEIADAFYDGMANVTERVEAISKVDETNAYIKERFGVLPTDSELEVILDPRNSEKSKSLPAGFSFMIAGVIFLITSIILCNDELKFMMYTILSFILMCTGAIICHIDKSTKPC